MVPRALQHHAVADLATTGWLQRRLPYWTLYRRRTQSPISLTVRCPRADATWSARVAAALRSRGASSFAEAAFHAERTIDRFRGAPYLSAPRCTRELRIAKAFEIFDG
jgi:hypothetical protein